MKKSINIKLAIALIISIFVISLSSATHQNYYTLQLNSDSLNQYKYEMDNLYYEYINNNYDYYRPRLYYSDYDGDYYIRQKNYYRPYYYQPIFSRPIIRSFGHGDQIIRVRVDNYYNKDYNHYDIFDDRILLNSYYYNAPKVKSYYSGDIIYLGYKKEIVNGIPHYYK